MPVRLQLSRRRGFDLQATSLATNGLPAVNVARPSKWGNPCKVGKFKGYDAADAVRDFKLWMDRDRSIRSYESIYGQPPTMFIQDLRGKNLACWCKITSHGVYMPCHADVLISIANDFLMEEVIRENSRWAEG